MAKYSFRELVVDSRTGLNPRKNFTLGSGNNYSSPFCILCKNGSGNYFINARNAL